MSGGGDSGYAMGKAEDPAIRDAWEGLPQASLFVVFVGVATCRLRRDGRDGDRDVAQLGTGLEIAGKVLLLEAAEPVGDRVGAGIPFQEVARPADAGPLRCRPGAEGR
jgi:hypothetical protein